MHPRAAIREGFKAALLGAVQSDGGISYATGAQDRVFATMTPPVNVDALMDEGPVIMVYARGETIKEEDYPASGFDGSVLRTLEINIEAIATGAVDIDGRMDALAEQIEAVIEPLEIAAYPSAKIRLVETQIDITDAPQHIVGGIFMQYHVTYLAPYRVDTSGDFLPDDVYAAAQGGARELIFDGDLV